jgi:hypothetical protein
MVPRERARIAPVNNPRGTAMSWALILTQRLILRISVRADAQLANGRCRRCWQINYNALRSILACDSKQTFERRKLKEPLVLLGVILLLNIKPMALSSMPKCLYDKVWNKSSLSKQN